MIGELAPRPTRYKTLILAQVERSGRAGKPLRPDERA